MKIHFPRLPEQWGSDCENKIDYLDYGLASPKISEKYEYNGDKYFYGLIRTYPGGSSIIKKLVISFKLDEADVKEKFDLICEKIKYTMDKFYKLCLIANDSVNLFCQIRNNNNNIEVYENFHRIPIVDNVSVTMQLCNDSDSITKNQLLTILDVIKKNENLPIEYDFLISGIEAYESGDNRKCIFELSIACELVMTNKIKELQNELGVKNFLKDYMTLERKHRLLSLLNFNIDSINISDVTNVRNDVIHEGKDVTNEEALKAIKATKNILKKLSNFI